MNHQIAKIIAGEYRRQSHGIWNETTEPDEAHLQVARVRHMSDHASVWDRIALSLAISENPLYPEPPHVPQ